MEEIVGKEVLDFFLKGFKEGSLAGYDDEEKELLRHLEVTEEPNFDSKEGTGAVILQARKDDDVFRFVVSEYKPDFPGAPASNEAYLGLLGLLIARGAILAHYETVIALEDRNSQLN